MVVPRIIEISETQEGGLYAVVEFRINASDEKPFRTEDFHWKTFSQKSTPRPIVDEYGRVTIDGEQVYPTIEVDGVRVRRPDLDRAETEIVTFSAEDLEDRILEQVIKFAERHLSEGENSKMRGDGRLSQSRRPPKKPVPGSARLRTAKQNLEGKEVSEDSKKVRERRKKRAADVEKVKATKRAAKRAVKKAGNVVKKSAPGAQAPRGDGGGGRRR